MESRGAAAAAGLVSRCGISEGFEMQNQTSG